MRWIVLVAGTAGLLAQPTTAQEVDPELAALVCGEAAGRQCEPIAEHFAGDAGTVLEVGYGVEALPADAQDWGCRFDPHDYEGGRGYWLIGDDGRTELILRLCNDGYGAAQVGEDYVTIADNRITHEQYGGSAWRWLEERTLRLTDPRAMLSSYSCSTYGATALWAAGDDWPANRTWIAWLRQGRAEEQESWCPSIDPSSNPAGVGEGFDIGLAINGYRAAGDMDAALAACGTGVAAGDGPVASAPGSAALRLIALRDADQTDVRLAVGYDATQVPAGAALRLAWTGNAFTMVEERGLHGDPVAPEMAEMPLAGAPTGGKGGDDGDMGPWSIAEQGNGRIVLAHTPFQEPYESNLLGLAAALVGPNGQVVAATVPWGSDGAALVPRIAWRDFPGAGGEDMNEVATAPCAPGPGDLAWPVPTGLPRPYGL